NILGTIIPETSLESLDLLREGWRRYRHDCVEAFAPHDGSVEITDMVGRNKIDDSSLLPKLRELRKHAGCQKPSESIRGSFSLAHKFVRLAKQDNSMVQFHEETKNLISRALNFVNALRYKMT